MRKNRIALILLVLLAALVAFGYWFVAIPDTETPSGSVSQARFTPGPYDIASERFELVDQNRKIENSETGEDEARVLDGEVWRPANRDGAGPLVIYSHGFLSFRQEGLYLTRFLVSHGYTVAAMDFPRTSIYALDNPDMADVINQPGDVSLLIDTLLERNADPDDTLYQTIDEDRIALAGVSLGGLTSILATFHPDVRDPRVAALVDVAGPASMFAASFYAGTEVPALLVYGDADVMVPLKDNGLPFFRAYPRATLVTLKDASHAGFSQPASTLNRFMDNPDGQACEVVGEKLESMGFAELGDELIDVLGGPEIGIEMGADLEFCASTPVPQAMKASRQHMFTTLAAHAFLESLFAQDTAVREEARQYLLQTLAQENNGEVSVTTTRPASVPGQDKLTGTGRPAMSPESVDTDPTFAEPYIDVDEWRDTPVRHRYIHGGFEGTDTRFSYYFPPAEQYEGRFFQHITPIPGSENLAPKMRAGEYNKIGFSIDSGAYFIETNGGGQVDYSTPGGVRTDPTITAYRANAAAARYSRQVAQRIYGNKHRPYGYCYGGSGGGYRTIGSIENSDAWDGAVPYVIGSTMAIPNMFSVRMHAMRILRDKFPQIVDAVEPGGSGDPYAGLTEEEAAALREVTRMGFPMPAWFGHRTMGIHGFAALYQGVKAADPDYFTDFWNKPGYLGFDSPESFAGARVQFESTILEPVTAVEAAHLGIHTDPFDDADEGGVDNAFKATPEAASGKVVGFRLAQAPPAVKIMGADLIIHSGEAAGSELPLSRIADDVVVLGLANAAQVAKLDQGDRVTVDNSAFLAAQTYHRHQVPGPDFPVWDQFRDEDGEPIYPQRPMLIGPLFVQATSGSQMTGEFDEKMIVVASLWDREAMPWQADWYRQRVAGHLGEKADQQFRLYYTDHALHGDEQHLEDASRTVPYQGMLQQALRDLAAWVESGVTPPASTQYEISDGQVIVPPLADERKGLQPVVALEGARRIQAKVGETLEFTGTITAPPGAGTITRAEWDFDGSGTFPVDSDIPMDKREVRASTSHRFDQPGTYFVVLRGTSQRQGDPDSAYGVIRNLDRIRVVVN